MVGVDGADVGDDVHLVIALCRRGVAGLPVLRRVVVQARRQELVLYKFLLPVAAVLVVPPHAETQHCPGTCCPIACSFSWTSWSSCSATCQYGTRKRNNFIWRVQTCGGTPCPASPQTQRCGNGRYFAYKTYLIL